MKYFLLIILGVTLTVHATAQSAAEKLSLKADKELDAKKYASALKLIEGAIKLEPYKYSYYIVKGQAQQGLEDIQGAYQTYSIATQIEPKNIIAYNARGVLLQSSLMFDEAIADYSKVIQYAQNDTLRGAGYLNRGSAKVNKQDYKGGYEDYLLAYKIDSLDIGLLNNIGIVCFEMGMEEEAFEYLHKIITLDSTFAGAYVNIGFSYQLKGYYEKSIPYFDKAEKIDPKDAYTYSNRSYSKLKLGDLKGAMKDIEKSILLYPGNPYAYRNRALIYLELGDGAKACADLYKAKVQGFLEMYGDEVQNLIKRNCN